MKINPHVKAVKFVGEGGEELTLSRSNMGEPYRDGVDFSFSVDDQYFGGFFEVGEVLEMHRFMTDYLGRGDQVIVPDAWRKVAKDVLSGAEKAAVMPEWWSSELEVMLNELAGK